MPSPPRSSYATNEEWQRRTQSDGYQRDPYPWTPEMLDHYNRYKAANHQHGHDRSAYISERKQREAYTASTRELADPPRRRDNKNDMWAPRNLTRGDHEHLGPMAGAWERSATRHRDLRGEFDHRYPQGYGSSSSRETHRAETKNANSSVGNAREYVEEHIRYGGQFMVADPYDNYDMRTGGSHHPGPDKDNPRRREPPKYR